MEVDSRLVLRFDEGQMTFRHLRQNATYEQMFNLANALNRFQADEVRQVLLVTVTQF